MVAVPQTDERNEDGDEESVHGDDDDKTPVFRCSTGRGQFSERFGACGRRDAMKGIVHSRLLGVGK